METVKNVLNFCNAAIIFDQKNIGVFEELNQTRNCTNNMFHQTIFVSRILILLSISEDIVLKNNNNDIENIVETIRDLRSNVLYMLSFEKVIREEQITIESVCDDNSQ